MSKQTKKLGSQAAGLFSRTDTPSQKKESPVQPTAIADAPATGGRPKHYHGDAVEKTTLTLYRKHLHLLDRLALDIREGGGSIDRGALVRGIVTAIEESGVDLRKCKTEADVAGVLRSAMIDIQKGG